jgi:hypothetical protein
MPSNFPNNPSVNDLHTIADITWRWDGVAWVLYSAPPAPISLNDLTDVELTSLSPDEILKYNGSLWINQGNLDGGSF